MWHGTALTDTRLQQSSRGLNAGEEEGFRSINTVQVLVQQKIKFSTFKILGKDI